MKKPSTMDIVLIGGGAVIIIGFLLYFVSHPNKSICDTDPNSNACLQETQSNNDSYNQYIQNGNH